MTPTRAEVFVLSDGTGETVSAAVRAAMLQFRTPWRLRIFAGVRTAQEVRSVVQEAEHAGALVVFSLVDGQSVEAVTKEGRKRGVVTVDLLGPLLEAASRHLQADPRKEPGLLHGISDDYFRRIEAVEFAVRHDDGANTRTLYQADIVLTGVSRTSKTPLSMYLAQRGYKTGNVPLVPELDPPPALLELEPRKVFALDIDPSTLLEVRTARIRTLGRAPYSAYADAERVMLELERARRLYRQRGWRIVNVSGRAVEENAARIMELVEASPPRPVRG
jgi:regulator of PEP synthase PpsR (kinase-PPPase family)